MKKILSKYKKTKTRKRIHFRSKKKKWMTERKERKENSKRTLNIIINFFLFVLTKNTLFALAAASKIETPTNN